MSITVELIMRGRRSGNDWEMHKEFLLGKPRWRGIFGRSRRGKEISDEYYNRVISFFSYSLDRHDDGYKTVIETCY